MNSNFFPFSNFQFYIELYLINNVVIVSGVQQSDSVIHIHVSILFQILFPFRLLHNTEQSSLCYTVGPCWLSNLNIAVCTCQSHAFPESHTVPFLLYRLLSAMSHFVQRANTQTSLSIYLSSYEVYLNFCPFVVL